MSGAKRVSVDSRELQRLREHAQQLRVVQRNFPEVLENLRRENQSALQNRLAPLEQRQREYQQAASRMREDVRNLEIDTARRMEEQQHSMRHALQDTANRLQRETYALVDEQNTRISNLAEREQQARELLWQETQGMLVDQEYRLSDQINQERQDRIQQIQQTADQLHQELVEQERALVGLIGQEREARQQQINVISRRLEQLREETHTLLTAQEQRLTGMIEQEREDRIHHIQTVANRLRHETHILLEEQAHHLTNMIDAERQLREQQFQAIHQRLDTEQQHKDELARSWIDTAQEIRDFITARYQHERFAPGQLAILERTLQQADANAAQGTPEAALSLAQQSCHGLSDLRLELERLEHEWNLWHIRASESTRELLAIAQQNRTCHALDMEGNKLDLTLEVDYWTQGKLMRLENDINTIITQLADDSSALSTDELRNIVTQSVLNLDQQLGQLIAEARLAVINSQLRANIADLVVGTLEEQGFQLQDDTYEGTDYRNGFVAQVKHIDSTTVSVVISPEEGGQNTLHIHSYDAQDRPEHELRARAQALAESLNARGLNVGTLQGVADSPDPAFADVEQVRQRQTAQRTLESE
jgi:hypothetical protein